MYLRDDFIEYIKNEVVSKVPNYNFYNGILRDFIMEGEYPLPIKRKQNRTDTNSLVHVKITPNLYSCALSSIWLVTGEPTFYIGSDNIFDSNHKPDLLVHLFSNDQLEPSMDRNISAFVVVIKIINLKKERKTPLIVSNGKFTNECCYMTVDNILLEDLIKYHHITYKIAYGYVWRTSRNHAIRDIRLEGDTKYTDLMIKPGDSYIRKISLNQAEQFAEEYKYYIEDSFLEDDHIVFVLNKLMDDMYVNCLLDLQVLNMAKHILNKYIYLAEDINVSIYFDDNGDVFINRKQYTKFKKLYEKIYRVNLDEHVVWG